MFGKVRVTFGQVFENFRKSSERGRKSSENRLKRRHQDVYSTKRTLNVSYTYQRSSKLSRIVPCANSSKNLLRLNMRWQGSVPNANTTTVAVIVLVIQCATLLPVWLRSSWHHHRGLLKLPMILQERAMSACYLITRKKSKISNLLHNCWGVEWSHSI